MLDDKLALLAKVMSIHGSDKAQLPLVNLRHIRRQVASQITQDRIHIVIIHVGRRLLVYGDLGNLLMQILHFLVLILWVQLLNAEFVNELTEVFHLIFTLISLHKFL